MAVSEAIQAGIRVRNGARPRIPLRDRDARERPSRDPRGQVACGAFDPPSSGRGDG